MKAPTNSDNTDTDHCIDPWCAFTKLRAVSSHYCVSYVVCFNAMLHPRVTLLLTQHQSVFQYHLKVTEGWGLHIMHFEMPNPCHYIVE